MCRHRRRLARERRAGAGAADRHAGARPDHLRPADADRRHRASAGRDAGRRGRHRDAADPVEVLAAFGGFELAMMVGVMLVAGSKRQLILADGMAACAALMVAAQIAPAVTDYCVFCRSNSHHGLDQALALFHASALLELGMESTDGTGATLAFPLVRSAAALLTEVAEGEDPGPTLPGDLGPASNFGAPV
ncbi:MAG: nicotinate-nucleotide--dimethylbenzimidazole phosphoribosyltransferase [Rhizobacter sp.]|nr:nicotinate-nucleotide--dimethylbenzimidazole phosphoribosyltransferase [Rhizobacter sp.]